MPRVPVLFAAVLALALAGSAQAQTGPSPVLLGTADSFAVLGGSTITNTGATVLNGDLGLHPGTAVTGFPPGTVNGAVHVNDAVAQQAKADLVTAYNDAAGRPRTATTPPDIGGQTLTPGVYSTGSVASLGLTGTLTLDAQGDPNAVFIFQVESTLTTATDSRVSIINGGQACNVFWQVGSSGTLGTRTSFLGTILALTSISVGNRVTADGGFMARNGAVTLDTDTVTRSQCATGSGPPGAETPGTGTQAPGAEGPGTEAPGGETPGAETPGADTPGTQAPGEETSGTQAPGGDGPGTLDDTPPRVRVFAPPGLLGPPSRPPGAGECTTRNFTLHVRVRDSAGIRRVTVYIDGRRVLRTSRPRASLRVAVRGLRVGRHRVKVVAGDREGNRAVRARSLPRCALAAATPRFTG